MFFDIFFPILTMIVGAFLGVRIDEIREEKRKSKADKLEYENNCKSQFSGVWGQFIYTKNDNEYKGKIVKRDEYLLTHLTQIKYPIHLTTNLKGSISRIRDIDPYKIGNREGRKWECQGYCDNNTLMLLYKALEPDDTKGCVLVKLFRDYEYRGYYIADHLQNNNNNKCIDLTPVIIRKFCTKYAVFDWDNTVRNGYTIFPWIEYLHEKNIFHENEYKQIGKTTDKYNKGLISHDKYAEEVGILYAQGLKGISVEQIENIEDEYIEIDKNSLFSKIEILFKELHKMGITIIVVSGAPYRIIRHYKNDLFIDHFFSFREEENGGIITGNVEYNYGFNKGQVINMLVKKYGCDPYMAFGDSESDYPLLDNALYPFFINKIGCKYFKEEYVFIENTYLFEQINQKIEHLKY